MPSVFSKDPGATKDYAWDWATNWLATSETISSFTLTVPAGLTKTNESQSNGIVTAWLSGGTAGATYTVTCAVTTNQGRTEKWSIQITMRSQ